MDAHLLTASDAAAAIRSGALGSEELVQACLKQIEALEPQVKAWAHLDPEYALEQARQADEAHSRGEQTGILHGLPVALKDIIDTADLPTENGCQADLGRTPGTDATIVDLLRQAGAVIMGKTVTAELATHCPGKTTNPHAPTRTPGGSSSGSAAAVAAHMVPLAIGTQTNGSVIRPASYCGIYGYKPTFGSISRYRILEVSRFLDTVGVFGRSLEDSALLADALMYFDRQDPDMRPRAQPRLRKNMAQEPPMPPRFAFVRTPKWDQVEASSKAAFKELIEVTNEQDPNRIEVIDLGPSFDHAHENHGRIMHAELANNFAQRYRDSKSKLSPLLIDYIEHGRKVLAIDYNTARAEVEEYNQILAEIFVEYDAILTPSAFGEAPADLSITGDASMNTIWSLCGVPAVTLPLFDGPHKMPIGAQLVGARGDDANLLRSARWLLNTLDL